MINLKKIILLSVIINMAVNMTVPMPASGQSETFDLVTFTPPKGFTKNVKSSYISYTDINNRAGTFCVIGIYASRDGAKKAEDEFIREWSELVAATYNITASPRFTTTNIDTQWKMCSASANASQNGQNFKLRLAAYTGNKKVVSILFNYNSDAYTQTIEDFLNSVRFANAAGPAPAAPSPVGEKTYESNSLQGFGGMRFYLPPQWTAKKEKGMLKLMPADFRDGELFFIGLLEPLTGESDFSRALQKTWQQIRSDLGEDLYPVREGTEIPIRETLQGFTYIRDDKQTKRVSGLDITVSLYLVKTSSGIERIAAYSYEMRAQGMDYSAITSYKYYYPVHNLIYTVQFAEKPLVKPPVANYGGSGITGVWCGISGSYSAGSGYGQAVGYFILLDNGTAYYYRKMPQGGLANLNTFMHRQLYPDYWGTYTFSNNNGAFTNYYYKRIDFALVNGKLKVTKNRMDHSFIKLPAVNGAKLNGTYALRTGEAVRFAADGTFYDNGALQVIAHDLYYPPYCPTYGGGEGTYEIRDYSIIFQYRGGRKFQTAFADWNFNPRQNSPQQIILGEEMDILYRR
jgi:hypothetical protein